MFKNLLGVFTSSNAWKIVLVLFALSFLATAGYMAYLGVRIVDAWADAKITRIQGQAEIDLEAYRAHALAQTEYTIQPATATYQPTSASVSPMVSPAMNILFFGIVVVGLVAVWKRKNKQEFA